MNIKFYAELMKLTDISTDLEKHTLDKKIHFRFSAMDIRR